jgi:hypothetical protein
MDWTGLINESGSRPGMFVRRPYVDGLTTLWFGFSLGRRDGMFERFALWFATEKFPAEGGHRSPLSPEALVRQAVTGACGTVLTEAQDDEAVALLVALAREHASAA